MNLSSSPLRHSIIRISFTVGFVLFLLLGLDLGITLAVGAGDVNVDEINDVILVEDTSNSQREALLDQTGSSHGQSREDEWPEELLCGYRVGIYSSPSELSHYLETCRNTYAYASRQGSAASPDIPDPRLDAREEQDAAVPVGDEAALAPQDTGQEGDQLVVNTTADEDDGLCGVEHCSLREAIATANLAELITSILISSTIDGTGKHILDAPGLVVTRPGYTIEGDGIGLPSIDASAISGTALELQSNSSLAELSFIGDININNWTLRLEAAGTGDVQGVISGTAGIFKAGSGVFTLFGNQTYSGTTDINEGTLRLGLNSTLPISTVVEFTNEAIMKLDLNGNDQTVSGLSGLGDVILGGATLTLDNENDYDFYGQIVDEEPAMALLSPEASAQISGNFVKRGGGELLMWPFGAYNYGGYTAIEEGVVTLLSYEFGGQNEPVLPPTTTLSIADGATLRLLDDGTLDDYVQPIAGLSGGGIIELVAGENDARLDPILEIGGILSASSTFDGWIQGRGEVRKVGSGTFTLSESAISQHPIWFTILDGRMNVNATTTSPAEAYGEGFPVLGGTGTISQTTMYTGRLAAGTSPGILTVETLYLWGSTLEAEIQGDTAGTGYDQVIANQFVSLVSEGGIADLELLISGYVPQSGDVYTIVRNDGEGPIGGTFFQLSEGAVVSSSLGTSGRTAWITYEGGDGNDIEILVNNDPIATDNDYTTSEDSDVSGDFVADDTGNGSDTDPEGHDLSVSMINGIALTPGQGISLGSGAFVTVETSGVFTYSPNGVFDSLPPGSTETDIFTYTVDDANGGASSATVTVTIFGVNDPPIANDDELEIGEKDSPRDITAEVLENDLDPDDGDSLYIFAINAEGTSGLLVLDNGVLSYGPNGQFDYLPEGGSTTDSFTYSIMDNYEGSDTAMVTMTITGVNDPPIANDDELNIGEKDGATNITDAVLSNDDDIDEGDVLTITDTDINGTLGLVTLVNGELAYDPNGQFDWLGESESAPDIFLYTITDNYMATDSATVTITVDGVNDLPEFTSTPVTSAVPGILYQYFVTTTDVDINDTHTIITLTAPSWLTLQDFQDGTARLSGTPSSQDAGTHSVELQVIDSANGTATQAFEINVANDVVLSGQVNYKNGSGVRNFAYIQIWEADDTGLRVRWIDNILTDATGAFSWTAPENERQPFYVIYVFPIDQWLVYESLSASSQSGIVLDARTIHILVGPEGGGTYDGNTFVIDLKPTATPTSTPTSTPTATSTPTPTSTPTVTPTATPDDQQQTGDLLTVNTNEDIDDGTCSMLHCSLREAINQVNGINNLAVREQNTIITIRFDTSTMGGNVLQPQSPLPMITLPVVIDGSSGTGGKILLLGTQAGGGDGLVIAGGGSTVQGMVISGFGGNGVVLSGSGGNKLVNNFIGTSSNGQSPFGNGANGVLIQSSNNVLGGNYFGAANLISANGDAGISISGSGNQIIGNFVGSDIAGTAALGNSVGLRILGSGNVIGGSVSGARNVLSGNDNQGILIQGGNNNTIHGNLIGVSSDGVNPLANQTGILVSGGSGNQLGGAEQGSGNIIGNNSSHGIHLSGGGSNVVQGSWIGTQHSGAEMGQGGDGVRIDGGSNNNLIGGPEPKAGNTIAFNSGNGVYIGGSTGNSLIGNSIYGNGVQGIDNAEGGNNEIEAPEIISVAGNSVSGIALPNTMVEVFGDSGSQGRHFLGRTQADGAGNFLFNGQLDAPQITSTGTDETGNTSEFSSLVEREIDCADTFEPNNVWDEATAVQAGQVLSSVVCSSVDIDFFKLPVQQIERGSRVVITLKDHTVDLDLALFRPTDIPDDLPLRDLPIQNIPIEDIPVESLPIQNIPIQNIPIQNIPIQNIPIQNIPIQNIPIQNIPIQNIPIQNIPIQNIPIQNIPLVSHSFQPGTASEQVSDYAINAVDHYYILVFGHNGAFSTEAYTLTIEVLPPPPPAVCSRDFPFEGTPGQSYQPFPATESQTLILFPKQRLERMYGTEQITKLVSSLEQYAEHESVKGVIVPLELDEDIQAAYDAWDDVGVCDVYKANELTYAIKLRLARALDRHPNIEHIILVGNDEAIPHRRILDVVRTSNEFEYTIFSFTEPDTALFSALVRGYMLTDDFYADLEPTLYRGRALYVPNFGLGRLVETPEEMSAVLNAFIESQGQLTAQTGLTYGYDFLKDSSTLIADEHNLQGLQTTTRIDDIWTADDLRQSLLNSQRQDLASLNAHFAHFLLQPADLENGGLLAATDILAASVDLSGSINYSVGCHSGLNVCDVCTTEFGKSIDADTDFAQAFASQGAWYVGNTGFGYGDTAAPTLSEELMLKFTYNLGQAQDVEVGDALRQAKQSYALDSMGAYGPYDEKVLIISTLYGLPNYRVTVPAQQPGENQNPDPGDDFEELENGLLKRTINLSPTYQQIDTEWGSYFATGWSGYQSLLYNPIQPRAILDVALGPDDDRTARGALVISGAYTDIRDFNPVITMPVSETMRYEPQFIYDGWQPHEMVRTNHFQTGEERLEQLVLTLGQFLHTDVVSDVTTGAAWVTGIERLLDQVHYELYYSNSTDYIRPNIAFVGATKSETENGTPVIDFVAHVNDDQSGVSRVLVTWTARDGLWRSHELVYNPERQQWQSSLKGIEDDIQYYVQALDFAGNVAFTASKGRLYGVASLEVFADKQVANEGQGVQFTAEATGSGLGEISHVQWAYGDGYESLGDLDSQHWFPDNGAFTISAVATDMSDSTATGLVSVQIMNVPPTLQKLNDQMAAVGQEFSLGILPFSDAGALDTHSAIMDWGDGTALEPVKVQYEPSQRDPEAGIQGELVPDTHIYQQPGIYMLVLCVTDKDGDTSCQQAQVYVGTPNAYDIWLPRIQFDGS